MDIRHQSDAAARTAPELAIIERVKERMAGRDRQREAAVITMYGDDWQGRAEPTASQRRKGLQKMSTVTSGKTHTVDKLLAQRVDGKEGARYLVRWEGTNHREDTWECERNISDDVIEQFKYAPHQRASIKVRKVSQLWLIERIVDRRTCPGPDGAAQSKVRWLGYGPSVDEWVNDTDIKPPTPRPAPAAAELAQSPPKDTKNARVPQPPPRKRPPSATQSPSKKGANKRPKTTCAVEPSATQSPTKKGASKRRKTTCAVDGLSALMDGIDEDVQAAALDWCCDNSVRKTVLIAELGAVEDFIAAMPMNPSGLAANAIRMRLGGSLRQHL